MKGIQNQSENEKKAMMFDFLWFFLRKNCPFKFPGWKGFLSLTNDPTEESKSFIEYMPPLNASINDNATIQELLYISQHASKEVGQSTTIVTFDLAVAKKAYNIIWKHNNTFRDVFVHLVFHTILSYLSAWESL